METSFESSIVPLAGVCSGTTDYPRFSKLIEATTYKPQTQLFFVGYNQSSSSRDILLQEALATLTLKIWVRDSRKPWSGEMNTLEFSTYVPRMVEKVPDDKYRLYYLRDFLQSYELHECSEWFKVNGELVNDPHAKEKPRESNSRS